MAAEVARSSAIGPDARLGVVVLTHNRRAEVARTLERLRALPERPAIVVVDNGSTDGTADFLRARFAGIQIVRLAANRGAAGRNVGVRACDRPYIALCDDDTWWEPGSLARAADLLDHYPKLAVITAKVLVRGERVDSTCLRMANSPLATPPGLPGKALLGFLAGASIVRRDAFLAAGGFEPRLFLGAEEALLTLDLASAGWALAYVDDLIVYHYPSPARDVPVRHLLLTRNALWIAWLRRPLRRALGETIAVMRRAVHDRTARGALAQAIRGLPWALANRRRIPPAAELQLRALEHAAPRFG